MTATEALLAVVEVLNRDNADSRRLWNILSALRGPDTGDRQLKSETTARLRYHIGINGRPEYGILMLENDLAGPNGSIVSSAPLPAASEAAMIAWAATAGVHFTNHIEQAIEALRYFQDFYTYPKR